MENKKLNKQSLINDFVKFESEWRDSKDSNSQLYDYFERSVDEIEILKNHCEIVSKHSLGYGEKPFRYLWALVFSQINDNSKFLEIGVFKGSILALSQLISNELGLNLKTYGLTPLNTTGDKYSRYESTDFENSIGFLYNLLNLKTDNTQIIVGLSTDEDAKTMARENGPYDIVYVDGGHDYDTVVNDIILCNDILRPGGILVMDDASTLLNFDKSHRGFLGHADVGLAIRDKLDMDGNYKHLFACGHNRVWRKLQ